LYTNRKVGVLLVLQSIGVAARRLANRLRHTGSLTNVLEFLKTVFSGESVIASVAGHLHVLSFFRQPEFRRLVVRHPHLLNKYFAPYLAIRFSKPVRRGLLVSHYSFIRARVVENFHDLMLLKPRVLWRADADGIHAITLAFSDYHHEGDLSVIFCRDGVSIFEISFSVIAGALVGSAAAQTLLIGRVQGGRGQFDAIRESTRHCHDVAPAYLLLAAVQGIAENLCVDSIAGVSNAQQLAKAGSWNEGFNFNYDAFWHSLSASRNVLGFYEMPLPVIQKPLSEVPISHRRRTRRKRLFKAEVASAVRAAFAEAFLTRCAPE
jgi:uncharacterized protein VirK/YbjX